MKKLRIILCLILATAAMTVFVACEFGTYDTGDGRYFTLESGGICIFNSYDGSKTSTVKGTYTLRGNTIKVTFDGETMIGKYNSVKRTITIGKAVYFRAVLDDSSEIDFDFSGTWDVK